jgi:ketosteroid isomerase-like protein
VQKFIEEQDAKFVEAFNKKDLDGILSSDWKSPELIVMYPDTTVRGYDALKVLWQKTFDMVDVKRFEITEQHIEVSSHTASDWGFWVYRFQPKGGPEISFNGRYTRIWSEKDGKWVLTIDHASVPLPPAPMPVAASKDDTAAKKK